MLKIRLQRTGRKNRPFYRVVVAEHSAPVKGNIIDQLGSYDPLEKPWRFDVDTDKVLEWIKKGAKPTNTVARLLKSAGVKDMEKYIVEMVSRKKKKAEEEKPDSAKASSDEKEEAPKTENEEKALVEEPKEDEKVKDETSEDSKEEEKKEDALAEESKEDVVSEDDKK